MSQRAARSRETVNVLSIGVDCKSRASIELHSVPCLPKKTALVDFYNWATRPVGSRKSVWIGYL